MRHSIQNKAFYIFDMAKKIYIKTRHAHMSRFDPETESRDLKEHTKHKQQKTLMSAFDFLCFLLITPLLIMALVHEFDTICASERRTTYLKRSKRDMRTCRVLTPRRRNIGYRTGNKFHIANFHLCYTVQGFPRIFPKENL